MSMAIETPGVSFSLLIIQHQLSNDYFRELLVMFINSIVETFLLEYSLIFHAKLLLL